MNKPDTQIIAEIANVHGGDVEIAQECVDQVKDHCDAVKFQIFSADELVDVDHPDRQMIESLEFSNREWDGIMSRTTRSNVDVIVDVFGTRGLRFAQKYDADGVMIHSSDMSNLPLIREVGAYDGQVILGVGGVTRSEVDTALQLVSPDEILLMYGVQSYPTALEHTFIGRVPTLASLYGHPVGFASHADATSSMAIDIPAYAVTAGAAAVEVHVTTDRVGAEYDYYSALEPDEFALMASRVRHAEILLQTADGEMAPHEQEYRALHRKWPTSAHMINQGEKIRPDDVVYKRAPSPDDLPDGRIGAVIGRTTSEELPGGAIITEEMLR